ncbi:hypothetical protein P152DRAFT_386976 [Eremomyces bilateralis CBS 781.70]|uniref:BHLH domain-containing protein n=1 Tax=Eremomyces bilateralis CBS 781.70 TaxID=1392243 RepID=A0A6G1GHQ9_9PEZI|nr:uncharacterized protein P152DRAFT_386976 [Eremomyces bilateralis CBS 781.70]KAF1817544.1 hypothetical protein P152DRAFT_386976 [Eremomyces bilateralis CBS 781.70]
MPSVEREDAEGQRSNADLKRSRGEQPDSRSACWTSPLCPNHTKQGTPPDPSTCGAACAPFLFGEIPESNEDPILFRDPNELTSQTIPLREATTGKGDGSVKRESGETQSPDNPALATNPDVPVPSTQATSKSKKRVPHNQVERKYRESLNTQLEALKNVVPSLNPSRIANGLLPCDAGDIEDLASTNKPSKAVILASATSYIKQVEREKSKLAEENEKLKARIKALQALVKCDDCSLMRYVMDLKIQPGARGPVNG